MIRYKVALFFVRLFTIPWTRMRRQGRENIPKEGGAILVCNHICLWDFATAAIMTNRHVTFVAKREIIRFGILKWIFKVFDALVVERGKAEVSVMKQIISKVKDGDLVLLFPEGTRNKQRGEVKLLPLQEGAAMVALRAKVPVVPIWIKGNYQPITGLRVYAGQPISFDDIQTTRKADIEEATRRIEQAMLQLCDSGEN